MIVVSDASILINLPIIEHLDLLQQLYGQIIIPNAVFNEITVKGAGKPGDEAVKNANWIEIKSCQDVNNVKKLLHEVDLGETEAITLCLENNANLLLIDEKLGRAKAHELSIKTLGLLGILLECKFLGLISSVSTLMDRLRSEANFRIGKTLYQ